MDSKNMALPTEKNFGYTMGIVLSLLGALAVYRGSQHVYLFFSLGIAFLFAALIFPASLKTLNVIWFRIGLLLAKVMNPIIMGVLFLVLMTPLALVLRVLGKGTVKLGLDSKTDSYWIMRKEFRREMMKQQF